MVALLLSVFVVASLWAQAEEDNDGAANRVFLPFITGSDVSTVQQDEDETQDRPDVAQDSIETDAVTDAARPDQSGVVHQGAVAARRADIALRAKETGIAAESIERAIAFQDAFADYADELLVRYPNQISAIWMEPVPGQRGYVRFTGAIPTAVTAEIAKQIARLQRHPAAATVVLTMDNVMLSGGGLFSMEEHARRAELAAAALANQGYKNVVTFFDPASGVINVELLLPAGVLQPSQAEVTNVVQNHIRADDLLRNEAVSAAAAKPLALNLTLLTGSGPIMIEEHTRGGNWIRDDGVRECTSGWSVRSGNVSTGFITAAHCDGINQFEEPGVALYSAPFIRQVFGTGGDVEYHTTPSHVVVAEFYADATTKRSVTSIKTTATMVGGAVCRYGRSSNVRACNHTVEATNVTVTIGGTRYTKMGRASNHTSIGGDSGGGWSFDNRAWGVHTGWGTINGVRKSYFTPVQQAQTVLGVTILTQ